MLKANHVLMAVASLLALGLSGCGKDNYQGTYTGYDVQTPAAVAGQTTPNQGYAQPPRTVTLTLSNNGDLVSGTYQAGASTGGFNGGYSGSFSGASTTYQFSASSSNSGQLTNVMMIPTGGYTNCALQGTLTSANHGQTISGSLSPLGASNSQCMTLQVDLTRPN